MRFVKKWKSKPTIKLDPKKKAFRVRFADQSGLRLHPNLVRLSTDASGESEAMSFASFWAKTNRWEIVTNQRGWPFHDPTAPGDLVSASEETLSAVRSAFLRRRPPRIMPCPKAAEAKAQQQLEELMAAAPKDVGPNSEANNRVFITPGLIGETPKTIVRQLQWVHRLIASHPDTDVIEFNPDANTLHRLTADDLVSRLEQACSAAVHEERSKSFEPGDRLEP
ncbi:hypothetical protein KUV65_06670 [Maritalea mobilis]|uniref:hypothetical protein n=1 Tax=Maritalea mobilis TaxID=483324 RepID=UPI001C93F681|nr:hypothetical protein [Maritalea mobilis]MBY6201037.1 hypothetical protein [Maritalea mobilis]